MTKRCPVEATHPFLDYQLEYSAERNPHTEDLSFVLKHGDTPVGLIFGQAITDEVTGRIEIGSRLLPIQLALLETDPSKTVTSRIRAFLVAAMLSDSVSECYLQRTATNPLSEIDAAISQSFVCNNPIIKYIINPISSVDNKFSNLRKGHKSAVRSSKAKDLEVSVVKSDVPRIFSEFRNLHHDASGRITRGEKTWLLQLEALLEGSAFLVQVRKEDVLAGGAYISISRDEAIYGVGAYSRKLMKYGFPIGHVAQIEVLRRLADLGISRYVIGIQRDNANINDLKLRGIDSFKKGFGTFLEVSLMFSSGTIKGLEGRSMP